MKFRLVWVVLGPVVPSSEALWSDTIIVGDTYCPLLELTMLRASLMYSGPQSDRPDWFIPPGTLPVNLHKGTQPTESRNPRWNQLEDLSLVSLLPACASRIQTWLMGAQALF